MLNVSPLPVIAFSKNPVNVVLTSDDFIAVAGVYATAQLRFKAAIAGGNHIAIVWAGGNLYLEAAGVPDDSGNQFPTGAGDEAHVRAVMAVLATNYFIDRDYVLSYAVTGGFPSIIFTAKKFGVLYNIAEVDAAPLGIYTGTAGVNLDVKPNFAHHLQVYIKTAAGDIKIYENNLQLEPGSGITTKDIAEVLNPYVTPNVKAGSDRPDPAAVTWQLCTESQLQYYIKYGQYYGEIPVVKKLGTSAPAFVSLGGLSVAAALNQTLTGYLRPGADNTKMLCLRQGSKTKRVQPDTPEFLYWQNLTGGDINIKIRIDIYYTDNSASTFFSYAPKLASAWQKYYIAVGYNAINLTANLSAGKQCAYYTARVISAAGAYLSAAYTYDIDRYREWPRYFIYLNSLGGYQTLYTYGKAQDETGRTKEDIQRQITYAVAAVSGSSAENNIRIQQKTTVNTGYTTARDIALLNDFLVSPEKYFYLNGKLIPIGISSDNIKQPADGDNMAASSFEFYPLYDEVVYTDDKTLAETSVGSVGSAGATIGYNAIIDNGKNADNPHYTDL